MLLYKLLGGFSPLSPSLWCLSLRPPPSFSHLQVQQQQQRQLDSGIYEQQIYVPSDLVGLAIGREGHNVNEVRKLDGILSVEYEDYTQMFRVRAKVSVD